jgi:catechol 2,3-dioxygenase-like lactoylglutathione lyase family enzyme
MSENPEPAVKLPPVEQVGIVVHDVDRAVEHFTALFGWGPFQIREVGLQGFTFRNRPGNCRLKMAFACSGPIEIELIQVLEGDTPHSQFLRQKGEGLHHLRFRVDNYDELLAGLGREGVQPVFHQVLPGLASFAYLDTDRIGGVTFELFQMTKRGKDEK